MEGEEDWREVAERLTNEDVVGLDDMTELKHVDDHSIADNLKLRLLQEQIYTCIGRVLIAVNPFKRLDIYDKRYINVYHKNATNKKSRNTRSLARRNTLKCSTAKLDAEQPSNEKAGKELPPHIYGLTDNMYENMMIEKGSQCVIISGESGAGKTVSAKYIMAYLSQIASGGTKKIEEVKNIIVQSNPLLEAFGNAKTLRNNNSSRFGKFVEILFNMAGQPDGGKISNFLLEKSRVVTQNPGERNYHVFYQLLQGCTEEQREQLGIEDTNPELYYYLNQTGVYDVPDADDAEEFLLTMNALNVIGMTEEVKANVLGVISAILHLGNVQFVEDNNVAGVEDLETLGTPAKLLGVDSDALKEKLVSRLMEARWGGKVDITMMTLNCEQAQVSRDALAKALYAQLFDLLVTLTNQAMKKEKIELCIGVLDIYGFEIFETNGFEQFCINYVNEKLQQIFVELTLKKEQEEYLEEGITWTPVKFFNNKLVCDLIESKTPPGIMSILDDVCQTVHASEGSDRTLMEKLKAVVGSESSFSRYFRGLSTHFEIHHYAGKVHYETKHFCERNKDVLFDDVIQLMQASENEFVKNLFMDMPMSSGRRGRGSTGSSKIKTQCQNLINRIMACTPHYVRCLKPSETKQPLEWCDHRILPQISYLGLRENIEVRRAGFVFRKLFDKMIDRYDIIIAKDVLAEAEDDKRKICEAIMEAGNLATESWKIGFTKVFMKEADMIAKLEEARNAALYKFAAQLQCVVRGFLARQYCKKLREMIQAAKIIQRSLRKYLERKRLNYRVLVRQHLEEVIAEMEAMPVDVEEVPPESEDNPEDTQLPPDTPESLDWEFTHYDTVDHLDYRYNTDLQNVVGEYSVFFTCEGKVLCSNGKMGKCLFVLSLYKAFIVSESGSSNNKKYNVVNTLGYDELRSISISVLDTKFLVLQKDPFDMIIESPHKGSLVAFFLALASAVTGERPALEKTDSVSIKGDAGNEIDLKFLKQGRKPYKEPRVSKSGNEITVVIPNMEEALEEGVEVEEQGDSENDGLMDEGEEMEEDNSNRGSESCVVARSSDDDDGVERSVAPLCLSIEFGTSGGKVSCAGLEVCVAQNSCDHQTVKLNVLYEVPYPSCLESHEILISPFVILSNMQEDQSELRITVPYMGNVPEDIDTMAKWIRFYSVLSRDVTPEWRDIRSLEDLSAFMVEIHRDHARLYTQQNVIFCILGSRDLTEEEVEIYGDGKGVDYSEAYGEYDYDYGYGAYNGEDNYGDAYGDYGEDLNQGGVEYEDALQDQIDLLGTHEKFDKAGEMLDAALHTAMPRAVLGLPPPVPETPRPPRPDPSPFHRTTLNKEETKKKKKEKKEKKKKT